MSTHNIYSYREEDDDDDDFCFTSLSTYFKSYQDDGRMIRKCSVQ